MNDRVIPKRTVRSERKVAVIGAGPAGLSAAYYLRRYGHECSIFDRREEPGGTLRYEIPCQLLPRTVLDEEIDRIRDPGIVFHMNREMGSATEMKELQRNYDAVILAVGKCGPGMAQFAGVQMKDGNIQVQARTFETSCRGVFAGGSAVGWNRNAAVAVAHGREIANSVHRYLDGNRREAMAERFDSRMGALRSGEIEEFLKGVARGPRVNPSSDCQYGFTRNEAVAEAKRCLICDCGKKSGCYLRRYADDYGATGKRYSLVERAAFKRIVDHPEIVFEPSKCIKCGRCVRISDVQDESYGLSFIGRSFDLRVDVPFGEPLSRGLQKYGTQCAIACPTGAMTLKHKHWEKGNGDMP